MDVLVQEKVFTAARGAPHSPGEIFRQPDLARTLRAMADAEKKALAGGASRAKAFDAVRDYFYRGDIARRMDAFSKANGGLLRYEDMAAFRIEPEEAVSTTFMGYTVYKPGFWSQGPAMIEALNILEGFNMATMQVNSADYIHNMTEALKLAYADRDTYYGDPKFNHNIPTEKLLSKEYGAERRKLITNQASMDFRPGTGLMANPPKHPFYDDILRGTKSTRPHALRTPLAWTLSIRAAWPFRLRPRAHGYAFGDRRRYGHPAHWATRPEFSAGGGPSQCAGGRQASARDPQPHDRGESGGDCLIALSTPGGSNQDQALLEVLFYNA